MRKIKREKKTCFSNDDEQNERYKHRLTTSHVLGHRKNKTFWMGSAVYVCICIDVCKTKNNTKNG